MKSVIFHYDCLIVNKKPMKNNCKIIKLIKKLNKNVLVKVYIEKPENEKSAKYYLDDHQIQYDAIVTSINADDYFVSNNTKELDNFKVAYLLAGKEDRRIKPGDVVELVSGSYPMSVESYNKSNKIVQVSFIGAGSQLETFDINVEALKKTDMTWQDVIRLAQMSNEGGE